MVADWFCMWICCVIEHVGYYFDVDWFLDADMFGM